MRVRELVFDDSGEVVVPELVLMELTAGLTDDQRIAEVSGLLHRFDVVPLAPRADTEMAAVLSQTCRRAGETVRTLIDCMIAAMAHRLDLPVLHCDRDFEVLARHTELRTIPTSP